MDIVAPALEDDEVASFQEQTHFNQVEVCKLHDIFSEVSQGKKYLDHASFRRGLVLLRQYGLSDVIKTPFPNRLFEVLDVNHDDKINFKEFITGMSLLCKGSAEDKLELSFRAYDVDGSGTISKKELVSMFKQACIVGYKAIYVQTKKENEWSAEWVDEFSDEVGQQLAEQAFENLDKDEDGVLSFQEFKEFAMSEPTAVAQLYGLSREIKLTL